MDRDQWIQEIAETIVDYREGEISTPDEAHVEAWIQQFDSDVQDAILKETAFTLTESYSPREVVEGFIRKLITNDKITGGDHCSYWRTVGFLDIQGGGNSQKDMLSLFNQALQSECGYGMDRCRASSEEFVYLDDFLFSGSRLRTDISRWVTQTAPAEARVHVIVVGMHTYGEYDVKRKLKPVIDRSGKKISFKWWRSVTLENRKYFINKNDVLRPAVIPDDLYVSKYVEYMKRKGYPPELRKPHPTWNSEFFSSNEGRQILETEFLKKGAWIYDVCPFHEVIRPLGFSGLVTLGFGSTLVTYRNCPNNGPLVFWAGDPWYPLFPRKKN